MPESELEVAFRRMARIVGLPTPEQEVKFHPTRRWRFDFVFREAKLAVEIEGGSWVNGGHNRGLHFEGDCEKYAEAVLAGWRVMRFTGAMVLDGRATSYVERALAQTLPVAA
jgi:very-short-patch-repair endonuclease